MESIKFKLLVIIIHSGTNDIVCYITIKENQCVTGVITDDMTHTESSHRVVKMNRRLHEMHGNTNSLLWLF